MLRRNDVVGINRVLEFEVEGMTGRGHHQLGWREQEKKDE